jgi:hypothetical protein
MTYRQAIADYVGNRLDLWLDSRFERGDVLAAGESPEKWHMLALGRGRQRHAFRINFRKLVGDFVVDYNTTQQSKQ